MKTIREQIGEALNSPVELERLYRESSAKGAEKEFKEAIMQVSDSSPGSVLIDAWKERLFYQSVPLPDQGKSFRNRVITAIVLSAITLFLTFTLFPWFKEYNIYLFDALIAHFPKIIFIGLSLYLFITDLRNWKKSWLAFAAGIAVFVIWIIIKNLITIHSEGNVITGQVNALTDMAFFPLFWILFGIIRSRGFIKKSDDFLGYIRFSGEYIFSLFLMILGAGLLSFLTSFLIHNSPYELSEIIFFVIVSIIPYVNLVLMDKNPDIYGKLSFYLAKVFIPFFLIAILSFNGYALVHGLTLEHDREMMLIMSVFLLLVLFINLYYSSGNPPDKKPGVFDWLMLALLSMSFIAAIMPVFLTIGAMLSSGVTPNRLTLSVSGILIMSHMGFIIWGYVQYLMKKKDFIYQQGKAMLFLPVYLGWMVFIIIVYPLLFRIS